MTVEYIRQGAHEYTCSRLVALKNARRFLGMPDLAHTPQEWEHLVEESCCNCLSSMKSQKAAHKFGLILDQIPFSWKVIAECLPVLFTSEVPNMGTHWVLVIGVKGDSANLVNYKGERGPAEEWIKWSDIILPKINSRKTYSVHAEHVLV